LRLVVFVGAPPPVFPGAVLPAVVAPGFPAVLPLLPPLAVPGFPAVVAPGLPAEPVPALPLVVAGRPVVCPAVVVLRPGVFACVGALACVGELEWLGALACGAGALDLGADGAELSFFCCPQAKHGTAVNTASRAVFRRILSLPLLNFITTSLTN
jgi:hypothetical protein